MATDTDDIIATLEAYRGRYEDLNRDLGVEGLIALADHPEVDRSVTNACEFLGVSATSIQGRISTVWREAGVQTKRRLPKRMPKATAQPATCSENLAETIYQLFRRQPHKRWTLAELSEACDRSEKSVCDALEALRVARYQIHETEAGVRLEVGAPVRTADLDVSLPELADNHILIGVVSDTHLGNLCAAEDQLAEVYERYERAGVLAVLHCGDLFDGPGNLGFRGHAKEVKEEAFTAIQQVRYASQCYPVAKGFKTYFIGSSKSHDGWEWARNGWCMGLALAEGTSELYLGKDGAERGKPIPPRPDLKWLDFDAATVWVGGERQTTVYLHHPDGKTAYAWSYNVQQWANALEGGTKPHVALLGHYHKYVSCIPRNIVAFEVPALCWQTAFMSRRYIPAHVGALLLELHLDNSGGVEGFKTEVWTFYQQQRKMFYIERG